MSKKIQNLRKQLSKLGVNKAQADAGTSEKYPAIFVRWNGDEEVFTGCDPLNPYDANAERVSRFADDKLK